METSNTLLNKEQDSQVSRDNYPDNLKGLGGSENEQDRVLFQDFIGDFCKRNLVYNREIREIRPLQQLEVDLESVSYHGATYGYDLKQVGKAFTFYARQITLGI